MRLRRAAQRLGWKTRATLAVLAGAAALVIVFRVTRPDVVALQEMPRAPLAPPQLRRLLELYTGAQILRGNTVEPLFNGNETYSRLWADLRSARHAINIQSYYTRPGAVADTLAAILRDRARHGVRVRLLFDAFGSNALHRQWLDSLRSSGVRVALLRPLRWYALHGAANRSHVRAMVIDGVVGYTGGFGFADYWQGDGRHPAQWRETNVRVAGPATAQLQAAFGAAWLEATGEFLGDTVAFPVDQHVSGDADAAALLTTSSNGTTAASRFLMLALHSARTRLYITNSYFVPDADLRRLLADAVRRGVDVRVVTAGPLTDVRTTRYAGRFLYEGLLSAGVRIYEYQVAMMHAKTLVVDNSWTAIGSMNFDARSMAFNDESTVITFDSASVHRMASAFQHDLAQSREITLPEFRRRGLGERLLELGANLLTMTL